MRRLLLKVSAVLGASALLLLPLAGPEVYARTPEDQRAQKAIDTLISLRKELAELSELPISLVETGLVRREDFDAVVRTALNDGAIIVNPADADYDEIIGLLEEVWA